VGGLIVAEESFNVTGRRGEMIKESSRTRMGFKDEVTAFSDIAGESHQAWAQTGARSSSGAAKTQTCMEGDAK